jgi:hypothetical protein
MILSQHECTLPLALVPFPLGMRDGCCFVNARFLIGSPPLFDCIGSAFRGFRLSLNV